MNTQNVATQTNKTQFMVQLGLMSAIIIVMAFTPLGYVRTPGLSITLLVIPVAVGAIILGPKGGAICGGVFGLTSLIQCFGMDAFKTTLFQLNPLGAAFTVLVPRILEGFLCGIVFQALQKTRWKNVSFYVASLICPLLNTLFFMSSLVLFFYHTDFVQTFVDTLGVSNPFAFVIAFVGVQGAIEAATTFIVASIISRVLWKVLQKA